MEYQKTTKVFKNENDKEILRKHLKKRDISPQERHNIIDNLRSIIIV